MRFSPLVIFMCSCLLLVALGSGNQVLTSLVTLYIATFIPLSIFMGRYRRSVKIEYELDGLAKKILRWKSPLRT